MSANRNKEMERAFLLSELVDYIREEGPIEFWKDLCSMYPYEYRRLLEVASKNHVGKRVPALLYTEPTCKGMGEDPPPPWED